METRGTFDMEGVHAKLEMSTADIFFARGHIAACVLGGILLVMIGFIAWVKLFYRSWSLIRSDRKSVV